MPVELGLQITIVSGIPDSLSCIPDSKAQDSGIHKWKFLAFRHLDSLTRGEATLETRTLAVSRLQTIKRPRRLDS